MFDFIRVEIGSEEGNDDRMVVALYPDKIGISLDLEGGETDDIFFNLDEIDGLIAVFQKIKKMTEL